MNNITRKEADRIAFENDLSGGSSLLDRRLAKAPKSVRTSLIKDNPASDEGRISAAIEIQRVYRGYRLRCNKFNTLNPYESKTAVYSGSKHHTVRDEDFDGDIDESGRLSVPPGTDLIRAEYDSYVQISAEKGEDPSKLVLFEEFSAQYIQDWWRKHRQKSSPQEAPTVPIQVPGYVPGYQPLPKTRSKLTERQAAVVIQRCWRRHIDIQVYRYYRDLINFKTRGNPSLMLRCINPREAKLLDAASGVHVKFRLAGERFPPNIYYKIFTHRPVQDMCSNSPKDYTKVEVKLKMAKDVHGRVRDVLQSNPVVDKDGWYQRQENNGWRLVSDRLIHHMADPITWESSNKKYQHHHDKLTRKQDVEKRKKQKKIEWMQKMYRDGLLHAKSDDPETVNLIEGAAAGMVATVEKLGPDALEDWEVDELLDWTTSLNFDEYLNNWKDLATSAYSEKQVEERLRLFTGGTDPYEFSVSTGPSRYQSTQQSRNTPASSMSGQGGHVTVT